MSDKCGERERTRNKTEQNEACGGIARETESIEERPGLRGAREVRATAHIETLQPWKPAQPRPIAEFGKCLKLMSVPWFCDTSTF